MRLSGRSFRTGGGSVLVSESLTLRDRGAEIVEPPDEKALMHRDEIDAGRAPLDPLAEPLERNTSEIAPQEAQP